MAPKRLSPPPPKRLPPPPPPTSHRLVPAKSLKSNIKAKAMPKQSTMKSGIVRSGTTQSGIHKPSTVGIVSTKASNKKTVGKEFNPYVAYGRPMHDVTLCIDCRLALGGGPLEKITDQHLGRSIRLAMKCILHDKGHHFTDKTNNCRIETFKKFTDIGWEVHVFED